MKFQELCRQVYEILKDPNNRCTDMSAADADGNEVDTHSPTACKWCLTGAMTRVSKYVGLSDARGDTPQTLYQQMRTALGSNGVWLCDVWDRTTDEGRQEIVDRLKKASEET